MKYNKLDLLLTDMSYSDNKISDKRSCVGLLVPRPKTTIQYSAVRQYHTISQRYSIAVN